MNLLNLIGPVYAEDVVILAGSSLIISDLHFGYEESLNRQGILVPRVYYKEAMRKLKDTISRIRKNRKLRRFEAVVLNGDIKDEFGKISETEWRHALRFFDYLRSITERIIVVKGNHDASIGPIAAKRDLEVVGSYLLEASPDRPLKGNDPGGVCSGKAYERAARKAIRGRTTRSRNEKEARILVTHGDALPQEHILKKADIIIIGHAHPAVQIHDGLRSEKYKCYLVGRFKRTKLIVQPSANAAAEGADVLRGDARAKSPFLTGPFLQGCDVYIIGDAILPFGKLRSL